jgi:hypothetical protein
LRGVQESLFKTLSVQAKYSHNGWWEKLNSQEK